MASNKINISDAVVIEENGTTFIQGTIKEESVKIDLVKEFKKFLNESGFELKFKKKSNKQVNRKPVYKFTCDCTEIKSNSEDFDAKCNKCNKNFEICE
jgi:hypothetical protein